MRSSDAMDLVFMPAFQGAVQPLRVLLPTMQASERHRVAGSAREKTQA